MVQLYGLIGIASIKNKTWYCSSQDEEYEVVGPDATSSLDNRFGNPGGPYYRYFKVDGDIMVIKNLDSNTEETYKRKTISLPVEYCM